MSKRRDIYIENIRFSHFIGSNFPNAWHHSSLKINKFVSIFERNLIFEINNSSFMGEAHSKLASHTWEVNNIIFALSALRVNINFKTGDIDVNNSRSTHATQSSSQRLLCCNQWSVTFIPNSIHVPFGETPRNCFACDDSVQWSSVITKWLNLL